VSLIRGDRGLSMDKFLGTYLTNNGHSVLRFFIYKCIITVNYVFS
jgi:hypothetical protein